MKEKLVLASVTKRIFARLFDIFIFLLILVSIFIFLRSNLSVIWSTLLVNIIVFLFFLVYFVCFPYFFSGQTLGKKLWSIKLNVSQFELKKITFKFLFIREFYIMFAPVFLTWIFYGIYLLLVKVFLEKPIDQFKFLSRASVIFVVWWIFIFLFIKIEPQHQLFYDRWFNVLVIDNRLRLLENKMDEKTVKKKNFKQSVFQNNLQGIFFALNTQQKEAVTFANDFNLRIIAGPGTGKTTVLINRIIFLLKNYKMQPYQILTLTFTRKACQNIKQKVNKVVNLGNIHNLPVFTYHGFCYWFLTREKRMKVTVLDQSDQKQVVKMLILQNPENSHQSVDQGLINEVVEIVNFLQQNMIWEFSRFLTLEIESDFFQNLNSKQKKYVWDIYQKYVNYKKEENLFDFVDLLVQTYQILQNEPMTLKKLRNKYHHLAIDEFQDTNFLQYNLVQLLTNSGKDIRTTVVGDPDQTIYNWRGSNINFILNLHKYFQPLKTVKLVINYRSQKNIVSLANHLISHNQHRIEKKIVATKSKAEKVFLHLGGSSFEQADFVVAQIKNLLSQNVKPHQIAILYRVNYLSGILENLLLQESIPYHIFKGQEFFKRKEIKELLVLLRILVEPKDVYVQTVLSWIKGIGPKTILKIQEKAKNKKSTIFRYLNQEIPSFLFNYQDQIQHFFINIQDFTNQLLHLQSLRILLRKVFLELYQPILMNNLDYKQRLKNIDNLIDTIIVGFERNHQGLTMKEKILEFLAQTQLSAADALTTETKTVKLMTIHNAKGLEFDCVFVFDVSGSNFPNLHRENIDFEEERRLFFVAITRAKKHLFITTNHYEQSPFIDEINDCSSLDS